MHIEFDDLRGEVRAGGVRAACRPAGRAGEVRVGGNAGPVLRPVTFGERSAATAAALPTAARRRQLCAALTARATVAEGTLDSQLRDVLVLALAGADDERAPSFVDTALRVLSVTGGALVSLLDAPAREVDRLSMAAGARDDETGDQARGWTRVEFGGPPPSLAELRDRLADRLLFRAAAPATARPTPDASLVPELGLNRAETGGASAPSRQVAPGAPAYPILPRPGNRLRTGDAGSALPAARVSPETTQASTDARADLVSGRPAVDGPAARESPVEAEAGADAPRPARPPSGFGLAEDADLSGGSRPRGKGYLAADAPVSGYPYRRWTTGWGQAEDVVRESRRDDGATDAATGGPGPAPVPADPVLFLLPGRRIAADPTQATGLSDERPHGLAIEAASPVGRAEAAELHLADALALALDDEADLRGLRR